MNFAQKEQFTIKKAGGLSVVLLVHAGLIGGLVYGLHSTYVTRPKEIVDIPINLPPPVIKPIEKLLIEPPKTPTYHSDFIPFPEVVTKSTDSTDTIKSFTGNQPTGPTTPTAGPVDTPLVAPTPPHVMKDTTAKADLENCKPVYPTVSRQNGDEGTVRVRFEIGADSQLLSASVIKSSGFNALDRAAVNALSKCSFKAAVQNGSAVSSSFVTDYVWSLE